MKDLTEVLKSLIGRYFKDEYYEDSIANVRQAIQERPYYGDRWEQLIRAILFKEFPEGVVLTILDEVGNLILHENDEEGAYRWLTLMVINVSRGSDKPILEEREFLNPKKGEEFT